MLTALVHVPRSTQNQVSTRYALSKPDRQGIIVYLSDHDYSSAMMNISRAIVHKQAHCDTDRSNITWARATILASRYIRKACYRIISPSLPPPVLENVLVSATYHSNYDRR